MNVSERHPAARLRPPVLTTDVPVAATHHVVEIRQDHADNHDDKHEEREHEMLGKTKKFTDPVCGMKVDPATAEHRGHAGKTYYFCSQNCADSFAVNPGRFASFGSSR